MNVEDLPVLPATTAQARPIYWEAMPGSGERMTVAVSIDHGGHTHVFRTLRPDVLPSLYGKTGRALDRQIDTLLEFAKLGSLPNSMSLGETLSLRAETPQTALAAAIRRFSSLASLDGIEDVDAEDTPTPEAQIRYWSSQMTDWITRRRPDLSPFLNQPAHFFNDGEPVKFGFLSNTSCAHFGVMKAINQGAGVKDARARIYELAKALQYSGRKSAGLIIATQRPDDPTLSPRQKDALARNLHEITREGQSDGVSVLTAFNVDQGGESLLSLVA